MWFLFWETRNWRYGVERVAVQIVWPLGCKKSGLSNKGLPVYSTRGKGHRWNKLTPTCFSLFSTHIIFWDAFLRMREMGLKSASEKRAQISALGWAPDNSNLVKLNIFFGLQDPVENPSFHDGLCIDFDNSFEDAFSWTCPEMLGQCWTRLGISHLKLRDCPKQCAVPNFQSVQSRFFRRNEAEISNNPLHP